MIAGMYPNEVCIQFWVHHTRTQMQFRFSLVKCSIFKIITYQKKNINDDEITCHDKQNRKERTKWQMKYRTLQWMC